jgi:hypothetical protein
MNGIVGVGPLLQTCQDRQYKLLRFYPFSLTFLVNILTPLHLERGRGEVPRPAPGKSERLRGAEAPLRMQLQEFA